MKAMRLLPLPLPARSGRPFEDALRAAAEQVTSLFRRRSDEAVSKIPVGSRSAHKSKNDRERVLAAPEELVRCVASETSVLLRIALRIPNLIGRTASLFAAR